MFNEHGENENEATFGKDNRRKGKKEKKNWRFAYDLYCKELISGSQPHASSHRSNASQEMSHRIKPREKSTNPHPAPHQNLLNQTTYVRHTATSNSVARREAYIKGTGGNPGRDSRNPSPGRTSKASRVGQINRSGLHSSSRRQIKTAAGSVNQRGNRSKASRVTNEASRVATANADLAVASREFSNESLGLGFHLEHSVNGATFTANNPTSNINLVEYPIPPEQPIVSGRQDEASTQMLGKLPSSLGASPDRGDIIAFAEAKSIDASVDFVGD